MEERLVRVREYLSKAYDYKKTIDRKHEQLVGLNQIVRRSTAVLTDIHISASSDDRKLEDAIIKICALRDELSELLSKYSDCYMEISRAVETLPNPKHREVLELRYLNFKSWEQVSDIIGKTQYHVTHRMHPAALDSFYKAYIGTNSETS